MFDAPIFLPFRAVCIQPTILQQRLSWSKLELYAKFIFGTAETTSETGTVVVEAQDVSATWE